MRSEFLEGKVLVAWLRRQGLLFSHLPLNTFTTSYAALARNKASGVVKGVPDYIIVVPTKPTSSTPTLKHLGVVLFVELKRVKGGTVSKEQKAWVEALTAAGCPAKVCRGAAEAIKFVEGFL